MTQGAETGVPDGFLDQQAQNTPLRRLGEAEEIADVLVFLGSKMSSFMTGTAVVADGGILASPGGPGAGNREYDAMERERLVAKGDLNVAASGKTE